MTPRKPATIGILFGIFLAALDSTLVVTALPTIVADFKRVDLYFLPIAIAMIVSTISMPVFGRLSDLYGRKRFHFAGIVLIILGSSLCAFAWSMPSLIAFRALQMVGAGALMPLSFTMIADLYPLEERAKMQGGISGVWGLAALLGPPLGGFITSVLNWRGVFWVTLPLGVVSLVIIHKVWQDPPRKPRAAGPDVPGAVLLVLASAALLGAFSLARHPDVGWTSSYVLALFGAAAVFIAGLVIVERRAHDPFMAVELFKNRLFWAGTLCSSLLAADMFSAIAHLPLFVQSVIGGSPMKAGMVLTPMMLAWVMCSAMGGMLVMRLGYRTLALTGTALATVAYFLLCRMDASATWGQAAIGATVLGAGLGCVMAPLLIAAQNAVAKARLGAATSLTQFSRSMAGALGVAVAGAVMSSVLIAQLAAMPHIDNEPHEIVHPVLRKELPAATAVALRGVMADAIRPVFKIGLGVAALAFLAALLLPGGRARDLRSAEATRTPGSPP